MGLLTAPTSQPETIKSIPQFKSPSKMKVEFSERGSLLMYQCVCPYICVSVCLQDQWGLRYCIVNVVLHANFNLPSSHQRLVGVIEPIFLSDRHCCGRILTSGSILSRPLQLSLIFGLKSVGPLKVLRGCFCRSTRPLKMFCGSITRLNAPPQGHQAIPNGGQAED